MHLQDKGVVANVLVLCLLKGLRYSRIGSWVYGPKLGRSLELVRLVSNLGYMAYNRGYWG